MFIRNQLYPLEDQTVGKFSMNLYDHAVPVCQLCLQRFDPDMSTQLIVREQYNSHQVHS